jgi:Domain of unknown function (DUF4365)
MAKTINESHITGERGVNAFAEYCNKHTPYLIWRAEHTNDFGIDGEVELSAKNIEGKTESTAEIIKIQIKSTAKGSYIKNETDISFEFYAKPDDIEYWKRHSLSVILIIYDDSKNQLYAKKIENIDSASSKSHLALIFDKEANSLNIGDNSFTQKFSAIFKNRINFDTQETIATNIFKFSKLPTFIFSVDSKVKNPQVIYKKIPEGQFPYFILKENKIFTFISPDSFPDFKKLTYKNKSTKVETLPFKQFLKNPVTYNYAIELLSKLFRSHAGELGIYYNKDYNRYYFGLKKDHSERKVQYLTRTKRKFERKVAIYKKYVVTEFFRHFGFEINYLLNEEGLFLIINPKFLFTSDRRNVLENKKKISQLTNFLTSKEHNAQQMNNIHFLFQVLSKGYPTILISDYSNATITLSKYISIDVPFGIPLDAAKHDDTEVEPDDSKELELLIESINED